MIIEDVKNHPNSKLSEIADRLPDVDIKEIRRIVYSLVKTLRLCAEGGRTNRTYNVGKLSGKK